MNLTVDFKGAFDHNAPRKQDTKKKHVNYRDQRNLCYIKLTEEEKAFSKTRARELKDCDVIESSTYTDYFKYLIKKDMQSR